MQVRRIKSTEELASTAWNGLCQGVPFRRYEWLATWWQHYGPLGRRELFVLAVYDGGELVGIAPWYLERSRALGRVIRFLGSGEVCSEYLSILCHPKRTEAVATALADWLHAEQANWDSLELSSVTAGDDAIVRLVERLERDCNVHRTPGDRCWRIELPETWDDFLARLSKGHRKQVRRAARAAYDSGRAAAGVVADISELPDMLCRFETLHRRRRASLGDRSCFDSAPFAGFLRDAAQRLLEAGALEMIHLTLDGRIVAVDYLLRGEKTIYAYQSGIDPDVLHEEPGRLLTIAAVQETINNQRTAFDFLRGDEPYKAHWRAAPRETVNYRITAPAASSKCRHRVWLVGQSARQVAKRGRDLYRDLKRQMAALSSGLFRQRKKAT